MSKLLQYYTGLPSLSDLLFQEPEIRFAVRPEVEETPVYHRGQVLGSSRVHRHHLNLLAEQRLKLNTWDSLAVNPWR